MLILGGQGESFLLYNIVQEVMNPKKSTAINVIVGH